MKSFFSYFTLFLFSIFVFSCTSDAPKKIDEPKKVEVEKETPKVFSKENLLGKWEVKGAVNDQNTQIDRFNGAFFEFTADGKFISTLKGLNSDKYEFSNNSILLTNQKEFDFGISDNTDSTIVLSMSAKGHSYKMTLAKKI